MNLFSPSITIKQVYIMNEIIAKGLKEQLRVLSIYLDEYRKQLDGDILSCGSYQVLKNETDYVKEFITNKYHI